MDYSQYKQLEFRRKFLKIFGAEITIAQPDSDVALGFIKLKAWKLKEDIRLFRDNTLAQEVMRISARSIIDFGATYDAFDSTTNQQLFSMRRKGLRSTFVRDHWLILDSAGNEYGEIIETSGTLALARRWLELLPFGDFIALAFMFVAQTYTINISDATGVKQVAATVTHRKNPFVVKMLLDTSAATTAVDARLNIAAVSLLSVVDATKNG